MVSVVLAAYKGEKYICEQVLSILSQLGENDELIISDDYPAGETRTVLSSVIDGDSRIKYVPGPGRGVIKNFEYGITLAQGDYIFLSDQDDKWLPEKVDTVKKAFEGGAVLVMHNSYITDGELNLSGETAFSVNGTKTGTLRNIIKNSYQGSCMAFDKKLKEKILPFPENLPMHDQWIGLCAEHCGRVVLLDECLMLYRRHSETVTGGGSTLGQKIKWRLAITGSLLKNNK